MSPQGPATVPVTPPPSPPSVDSSSADDKAGNEEALTGVEDQKTISVSVLGSIFNGLPDYNAEKLDDIFASLPSYAPPPPRRQSELRRKSQLVGFAVALSHHLDEAVAAKAKAEARVEVMAEAVSEVKAKAVTEEEVEAEAEVQAKAATEAAVSEAEAAWQDVEMELPTLIVEELPLETGEAKRLREEASALSPKRIGWARPHSAARVLPKANFATPVLTPISPIEPSFSRAQTTSRVSPSRIAALLAPPRASRLGLKVRTAWKDADDSSGAYAYILSAAQLQMLRPKQRVPIELARRRAMLVPRFYALPEPLLWPMPEVSLFVSFSASMLQSASAVLGAACVGYKTLPTTLALCVFILVCVFGAYAYEAWRILIFSRHHGPHVWNAAEAPRSKEEMDDSLIALLVNATKGLMMGRGLPLVTRELGSFEVPEEEEAEPARTERALARAFMPWRSTHFRDWSHGAALLELSVWLGDASGSRCEDIGRPSLVSPRTPLRPLMTILRSDTPVIRVRLGRQARRLVPIRDDCLSARHRRSRRRSIRGCVGTELLGGTLPPCRHDL